MNSETHSETHYNQTFKRERQRILKAEREKQIITYKTSSIKYQQMTHQKLWKPPDSDPIYPVLKEKYYQPRNLNVAKLFFQRERERT